MKLKHPNAAVMKKLGWPLRPDKSAITAVATHACYRTGCTATCVGQRIFCDPHYATFRTARTSLLNHAAHERRLAGKGPKKPMVVQKGKLTPWAMENVDKAREFLSNIRYRSDATLRAIKLLEKFTRSA